MLQIGHSSPIAACIDSDNWLDADSPHIVRLATGDPVFTPHRMAAASEFVRTIRAISTVAPGLPRRGVTHLEQDGPRFAHRREREGP
jgi:hypothetical protein